MGQTRQHSLGYCYPGFATATTFEASSLHPGESRALNYFPSWKSVSVLNFFPVICGALADTLCSGFIAAILCWVEYFKTDALSDITWSATTVLTWSTIEVGMYLIAPCLLSYQPLVKFLWRKTRWGQRSSVESTSQLDISGKGPSRSHYQLSCHPARLKDDEDSIGLVTMAQYGPNSSNQQLESPGGILVEHRITIS